MAWPGGGVPTSSCVGLALTTGCRRQLVADRPGWCPCRSRGPLGRGSDGNWGGRPADPLRAGIHGAQGTAADRRGLSALALVAGHAGRSDGAGNDVPTPLDGSVAIDIDAHGYAAIIYNGQQDYWIISMTAGCVIMAFAAIARWL